MLSIQNKLQFKELLTIVLHNSASDMHLSVGALPIMRVHNKLQIISEDVIITTEFVEELAEYLTSLDDKELKKGDQLFFAINLDNRLRAKVTIFYQKGLPAITLRFIPERIQTLEQLNIPISVERLINRDKGLVIITGPYGSGKSATLSALLQSINTKRKRYIVTLEQPIEYMFTSQLSIIEQREVGKDTESFEKALSYLQHEDVDIIAVSTVSSEESILKLLELARGNALVLISIESSTIISALEKIIQLISEDKRHYSMKILAEVFIGGIGEKLVPKIGGGLMPAIELLFATAPVQSALQKGDFQNLENLQTTGAGDGMVTYDQSLIELVKRHTITPEDAQKFSRNPKALESVLGIRIHQ